MSTASARAHEPSMEEILASIRRIIADDQGSPRTAAPTREPAREPEPPVAEPIRAVPPTAEVAVSPPAPRARDRAHVVPSEPLPEPEFLADEVEPAEPEPPVASTGTGLDLSGLDITIPEIMFSDHPAAAAIPPRPRPAERSAPTPTPAPPEPRPTSLDALISHEATASIGDAFNLLSHTVLANNARTLEDLVRELLKPMLKVWLDDNLPPLVERLVRAEIERVARGR